MAGQVLTFETSARASADAHALSHVGLAQFDLIADVAALILGTWLLAQSSIWGVALLVISALSLIGTRWHPFQRWLIVRRFGSLLGQRTRVTTADAGVTFTNALGSSTVPWASMTAVRSNERTVAFFRGRLLLGYVPAEAFTGPEAQATFVAEAGARIGAG